MILRELATLVAEQLTAEGQGEFSYQQVYRVLRNFFKNVETSLSEGDNVRLDSFGTFKSERTTGSGYLPGRPRSRKFGVYFKASQDMRARIRANRMRPKNPYSPVLRGDPAALARVTGRCPSCGKTLPVALPLCCLDCGDQPFRRNS